MSVQNKKSPGSVWKHSGSGQADASGPTFQAWHKSVAHELDTANFFDMAIEDLTSDRAVEAGIPEVVTNQSRSINRS